MAGPRAMPNRPGTSSCPPSLALAAGTIGHPAGVVRRRMAQYQCKEQPQPVPMSRIGRPQRGATLPKPSTRGPAGVERSRDITRGREKGTPMTREPAEPLRLDYLIRAGTIHSMTGETY